MNEKKDEVKEELTELIEDHLDAVSGGAAAHGSNHSSIVVDDDEVKQM